MNARNDLRPVQAIYAEAEVLELNTWTIKLVFAQSRNDQTISTLDKLPLPPSDKDAATRLLMEILKAPALP